MPARLLLVLLLSLMPALSAWAQTAVPEIEVEVYLAAGYTAVADDGTVLFPDTQLKSTFFSALKITNTGDATLTGMLVTMNGPGADQFHLAPPLGTSLAPGASTTFYLWFNPTKNGQHTAALHITSNDADESPYEITLQGQGGTWDLDLEQPAGTPVASFTYRRFPDTALGSSSSLTFVLKNMGTLPLSLDPEIGGYFDSKADFTVTTVPAKPLLPGETTTMVLTFTPRGSGTESAELSLKQGYDTFIKFDVSGKVIDSTFSFTSSLYEVNQGATQALITLKRTNPGASRSVYVYVSGGIPTNVPPFSPALAGKDFVSGSDGGRQRVVFAEGASEATLVIPLIPQAYRAGTNLIMNVGFGNQPFWQEPVLHILGTDKAKPTLTLTTPAAGKVSGTSPFTVTGKAGDAMGLRRVEVKLNAGEPMDATLLPAGSPSAVPFTAQVTPVEGANVIVVTAHDLRGNSTTVTRSFTFTRRYHLFLDVMDLSTGQASKEAGTLLLSATPAASATALSPVSPSGSVTAVLPGTYVTLTPKPGKNFVFHHWDRGPRDPYPDGPVQLLPGTLDLAHSTTYAADAHIRLWLMPTPFKPPAGGTNTLHWLLPPHPAFPSAVAAASLSGTMTASGSFTGKLMSAGAVRPVVAIFTGAAPARIIYNLPDGTKWLPWIDAGGGFTIGMRTVDGGTAPEAGGYFSEDTWIPGRWARYSATHKVPAQGLNPPAHTKGSYTMSLTPSDRLKPLPTHSNQPYPRGSGYASWSLTPLGQATLTGALADGSTFTSSTPLVSGTANADQIAAPVFLQLASPGSTVKSSVLMGDAIFEFSGVSVVYGDFFWLRPSLTVFKITPYWQGWPQGFYLAGSGTMYFGSQDLQTMLGTGPYVPGQANASLTFSLGGLTNSVTKSNFAIHKNAIIKLPPADASYTLSIAPATGLVTGTFTPNWPDPSATKPAFKGILVQGQGAQGFFLNNTKIPPFDAGGTVILSAPPPAN